jgi:SAM-dependent methyltransferase
LAEKTIARDPMSGIIGERGQKRHTMSQLTAIWQIFAAAFPVSRLRKVAEEHAAAGDAGPEVVVDRSRDWPANPPLPLPGGFDEQTVLAYLLSATLAGAPAAEMTTYVQGDYRRFLHTLDLVPDKNGKLLEIGANPYYMTLLIKKFRRYDIALTNYFSEPTQKTCTQELIVNDISSGEWVAYNFISDHFNTEVEPFPYDDHTFDVILFCEVIEHLQSDPLACLSEINRVLKPGGTLVLTTPNVNRLENVLRLIAGENIYDPYSGYGSYGRHNREYSRDELMDLLRHCGFEPDIYFSADARPPLEPVPKAKLLPILGVRDADLGQYHFVRARKTADLRCSDFLCPAWLYGNQAIVFAPVAMATLPGQAL